MQYTEYITKNGDTWSGIAFKAYGDVTKMKDIIEANPYTSAYPVLPAGIVLLVPIAEKSSVTVSNLPPWKR
jgi:nucleoid-associated protein YgaU